MGFTIPFGRGIQPCSVTLNIFFTVVLIFVILGIFPKARLTIQTSLVPWLCDICEKLAGCACNICKMIVDCLCYAFRKFADTAIETDDKYRREKDAHSQAREESVSNEYEKRVGTQSNAIRELAKDGVPPETMTEFVRSTKVPKPQGGRTDSAQKDWGAPQNALRFPQKLEVAA